MPSLIFNCHIRTLSMMTRLETCNAPPCLSCCATAIAWSLPCTRSAPYSLYLLAIDPLFTACTPPRFTMASPTIVRLRHHTESTLAATRTLHEDMDMTHGTPCTPL
uniref:Uncharacterized protein n=1 Tax=Triticum urartu TaxID=4572 RepID=A0A8R7K4K1_TRIUA